MVGSRTLTAAVGIVASLAISVALYLATGSLLFFLFVPFVPFLFRGIGRSAPTEVVRRCPRCSFRTTDPEHEYCPRDGSRLEDGRGDAFFR